MSALSACAVSRTARDRSTGEIARDAAMQPLTDVGIMRPRIDAALMRILEEPYRLPETVSCARLSSEIGQLEQVLGPDYDLVPQENSDAKKRRDAALGLAGRVGAGLLIPFRGVVREISGSAKKEREYRAAVIAGVARRSYLKGHAVHKGCTLPVYEAPPDDSGD
ncbi:hypothetical protein KCG44_07125 [Pacificimonas sp. WHA3]|uniref:Uncharacterized protein n=1 Tax=Pacificimonas pallii TaxID=2827236 RepID=A0ABS6SDX0_9SPHN|nr:hypothetical protein [Pacificimonas pallii]MBV7256555.1 hypothetical protein [Pacificimonas pallii]